MFPTSLTTLVLVALLRIRPCASSLIGYPFTFWYWQSSIVLYPWLYIDAGSYNQGSSAYYLDFTVGIDLRESWTNYSVVSFQSSWPEGMQSTRRPILWSDPVDECIYKWAGWPLSDNAASASQLWRFAPFNNGTGNWSLAPAPTSLGLQAGSLPPFGAATVASGTTLYALGGAMVPARAAIFPTIPVQGLVEVDFRSQAWTNASSSGASEAGFMVQAGASLAPQYGPDGFLVFLGGDTPETSQTYSYEGRNGDMALADFASITLYDISNRTWYHQPTVGDNVPPPRSHFCSVGISSPDNSSFEIFIYGGSTNLTFDSTSADDEGYLNVYALSIPAFRWFKSSSTTSQRRSSHYCQIIGNRQMLSIGGANPSSLSATPDPDPWSNGLGVFDMTAFAWTSLYEAAAEPYEKAEVMKKYYTSSYQIPQWSDPTLAQIFAFTPPPNSTATTIPTSTSTSTSPPQASNSKSHTDTGAIAGGVVGGLCGLALIVAFAIIFLRRQHSRQLESPHKTVHEKDGTVYAADRHEASELRQRPAELPVPPSELEVMAKPVDG